MARLVCLLALIALGGCVPAQILDGEKTAQVADNPFGVQPPPAAPTKVSYAPADQKTAEQVYRVGKELLVANPQIALRPLFGTIGVPQLEIFHVDNGMVYVTEGLVKQCKSDADLAAVLAVELGKMVAEREAHTSPDVRSPERQPPIQVGVGGSAFERGSDMTAMAELARFEKSNPKTAPRSLPRPNPTKLAGGYLEKAGFGAAQLDAVAPILQAADKNVTLERQFKGALPQSPWTP